MTPERKQVGWKFWLWWVLANTVPLTLVAGMAKVFGRVVGAGGNWPLVVILIGMGISQWLVLRQEFAQADWWLLTPMVSYFGGLVWLGVSWGIGLGGYWVLVVFAVAQLFVLRPQFARFGWWVLASKWLSSTILGVIVVGYVGIFLSDYSRLVQDNMYEVGWGGDDKFFGGWVVSLVVMGVAQWLILRQKTVQAGWWLLTILVSWSGGVLLGLGAGIAVYAATVTLHLVADFSVLTLTVGTGAVPGAITGVMLVWLLRQPLP